MKTKTLTFILIVINAIFSCKTSAPQNTPKLNAYEQTQYTKKVQIAEAYVQETVSDRRYNKMLKQLEDVFAYWIENRVSTKIYWDGYTIPKNMFFNHDKSKVLLLVQRIYKERNKGTVQLVVGEKVNGTWQFYDRGIPSFTYPFRGNRKENQPTLKELEYRTIQTLCEDGLVKFGKVSQKYINEKWF